MGHEKSCRQLMGNGEERNLQLGAQGEDSQGDLKDHKDNGGDRQDSDRKISPDREDGTDTECKDGKTGSPSELAVPQNPFTLFPRGEALLHGPLAGHGGPKDTLAEHQQCGDHGQWKPPSRKGADRRFACQALAQSTDEENKKEGRRKVGRDRGGSEEPSNREGTKETLKSNQTDGQG